MTPTKTISCEVVGSSYTLAGEKSFIQNHAHFTVACNLKESMGVAIKGEHSTFLPTSRVLG